MCRYSAMAVEGFSWESMIRKVLIVEDTPSDAKQSVAVVKKLGAEDVTTVDNVATALLFLQDVVEGAKPSPDLILLDLSFPKESGFEVLRYWKSNPKLQPIKIVVWTVMGDTEKKLCEYFGIEHVVPKWAGPKELETALRTYIEKADSAEP
jgi:CheY-like chemotaxis protein